VNTDTITLAIDLPLRPETRDDARVVIIAYAMKALRDAELGMDEQYARMLSVALWRDVKPDYFTELVCDMGTLYDITSGADLNRMFGQPEPGDEEDVDDETRRGNWITYFEDAINFTTNTILDNAGW
jgi:hypothetical protein